MALLKEDGSLDVERINQLPLEEYMEEMGSLTQEQVKEYLSKVPLVESNGPIQPIVVDYPMEEDGVDAEEFLNKQRENYGLK